MAGWDALAKDLSRTVFSIDADARFRLILLRQQCERLHSICSHMQELNSAQIKEKSLRQSETLAVEQSIQDAVQRARHIRAEQATNGDGENGYSNKIPQTSEQLQNILAIAKATRTAQQSSERVKHLPEGKPRARLKYPRKLKALVMQLSELQEKEQETSIRFSFCCKTSEYLSLSHSRQQLVREQRQKLELKGKMNHCVARIQTSFPCQVASLQYGYQRLMEFLLTKLEIKSLQFEQVAKTPTLSSVFPVYHRLKQAKRIFRLLNSEIRALPERLPSPAPQLSQSTATYRDALLARICKKAPRINAETIHNQALRDATPHLRVEQELLERLQKAWATDTPPQAEAHRSIDSYLTAVRAVVLTELSNAVLWSFKTYFTDTAEQPNASQVEAVMRLVRLVDSVVLSRGRTYRSIVAPH